MTHDESIMANLDKANVELNKIQGNQPVVVVQAAMSVAHAYLLAALVGSVRELTDEVRNLRAAR